MATAWSQGLQVVPTVATVAGNGTAGSSGDGGAATGAQLNLPLAIVHDAQGNLYIADYFNSRVRKVAYGTGIMTTVAGNGTSGYSGDGVQATATELNEPGGVLLDNAGNLLIADSYNHRVRKVNLTTGIISTIAGTGTGGYNGDGIQATAAELNFPDALAFDSLGNLYIVDDFNFRVRKITAATGIISTVAGNGTNGFSGDGGLAVSARINYAFGINIDSANNIYLSDSNNNRVRLISATTGIITTVAGAGSAGFSGDGGAATSAQLNFQDGTTALDGAGNLYITDENNNRIRVVNLASGIIDTFAGTGAGTYTGDGGAASSATFNKPQRIEVTGSGVIYIADSSNNVVRSLTMAPPVFPGTPVGGTAQQNVLLEVTGAATSITSFSFASSQGGVAEYTVGTVTGCTVDGSTLNPVGTICSVPVTFRPAYPGSRQQPLKAVTSGGTFYFGVSGTGQAAQVALTPGTMSTVAGTGLSGASGNNAAATSATLNAPSRAAVDAQGNVYIADTGNNQVREVVASSGNIVLRAGTGTACPTPTATCGDGGAATSANLAAPESVAVDAAGNLFIADTGDSRIRKVDAQTGTITTVAGSGSATYSGDGGQATAAGIGSPRQAIVDTAGNLYIAASGDNAVRYVAAASGVISTLSGNGAACSSPTAACGDGGPAAGGGSQLNAPSGVARDAAGDLFIADTGDNRVRRIDAMTGQISTVAGTGTAGYTGDTALAVSAQLNGVYGVDVDAAGNLYLADRANAAVRLVVPYSGNIRTIAGNGTACNSATATCGDGGLSNGADLIAPASAAVDSFGNLYIADSGENRIRVVSVVQTSFNFATATVGSPSSDNPEDLLVTNIGNQTLTGTPPSSGTNPVFPAEFSYDTQSSTCPLIAPGSAAANLPAGAFCVYGIDFQPATVGGTSGLFTLADNALNDSSSSQSVQLSGTGALIFESDTLSSSNTSPAYGVAVIFTDTIPVVNGITPTGTVSFYNGATLLGTSAVPPSGMATFTIASLPVGTDSVTAIYGGDANYGQETSNAVTETVGTTAATATSTALTSSASPSAYGQSVTLTATIGYSGGGAVPTGLVTFYSPGASTAINLQATPTSTTTSQTLSLAAGTYSVSILGNSGGGLFAGWNPAANPSTNNRWTDRYGIELCLICTALVYDIAGDPEYGTDVQALAAFQGVSTLNMTVSSRTQGQNVGNPYTFTLASPESVSFYVPDGSFANGAFTNSSSFADDSGGLSLVVTPLTALGSGTVNASGVATFTTSALPIGTDPVQAVYSGDATYVGSSSGVLSQVVTKATGSGTLTSSNTNPTLGQSVTFTDTLPAANGSYASGTVTFYDGSTMLGTGTLSNGVATCTTSALLAGTDSITAAYSGDTSFAAGNSNAVTETVGKSAAADTLTASTASPVFGQSVTFTDTIPVIGGIAPTGTVTFYNGTTVIGKGTVNSSGVATLTTGSLPPGTDSITAVYGGDANYASVTAGPVTETVAKAAETATLTASSASVGLGQSVTFTDTVVFAGSIAPTGSVTFYNGTTVIGTGTVSTSGVATLTTGSLPAGSDSITAVYGGDANFLAANSGPVTVTVAKSAASDSLTSSSASMTFGQSVTLTDTIPVVGGIAPTGTVTFYNGTTAIGMGTVNASGVATLATGSLPPGTDSITAVYSGDANYASVTSNAVTETVAKASGTDTLTSSNASIAFGQSVTFTDTIPIVGGIAPTGTVTFYNETTVTGKGTVNSSGVATLTTGSLPPGTDSITAVYSGDANYASVTSNSVTVTVAPAFAASSSVLTASATSAAQGQAVTFTDTVSGGPSITPAGTVTFYDGTAVLGTSALSAAGVATLTTSSLGTGSHPITAFYSGDTSYAASTSNAVSVTVTQGDFTIAATPANQTVDPGGTASYTISLAGLMGPLNGPIVLSASGLPPEAGVSFSPGSVILGAGTATAVMTIATSSTQAGLTRPRGNRGIGYAWLLLPLLGFKRLRKALLRRLPKAAAFLLMVLTIIGSLAAVTALAGCGSGGYFGRPPHQYSITVTGTSGSLEHQTSVTLTVR